MSAGDAGSSSYLPRTRSQGLSFEVVGDESMEVLGQEYPSLGDDENHKFSQACFSKFVVFMMVTVQAAFSGWHVLGKEALDGGQNPVTFAVWREVSASLLMFAAVLLTGSLRRVQRADWPRFVLLGWLSFSNVVGFVVAETCVSAAVAASMQPAIPVFACLLSILLKMETLTLLKALGLFFAVAGGVLVAAAAEHDDEPGAQCSHLEAALAFGMLVYQTFSMGAIFVVQKPLLALGYPATAVTAYSYSIGSLFTVLTSLYWANDSSVWLPNSKASIVALVYAALMATVYAYMVMTWANKHLHATVVALFSTLQPVFTTVFARFFMNQKVAVLQVLGALVVATGLGFISYAKGFRAQSGQHKPLLS